MRIDYLPSPVRRLRRPANRVKPTLMPVPEGTILGLFGGCNAPTAVYTGFSPPFHYDQGEGLYIGGMFRDDRVTSMDMDGVGRVTRVAPGHAAYRHGKCEAGFRVHPPQRRSPARLPAHRFPSRQRGAGTGALRTAASPLARRPDQG